MVFAVHNNFCLTPSKKKKKKKLALFFLDILVKQWTNNADPMNNPQDFQGLSRLQMQKEETANKGPSLRLAIYVHEWS